MDNPVLIKTAVYRQAIGGGNSIEPGPYEYEFFRRLFIAGITIATNGAIAFTTAPTFPAASIPYSELNLAGGIVNADINAAAGIVYSKLSLAGSIVNADVALTAGITYGKLALTNSIVNADIAAAAGIAYSKLSLANSIVNADIAAGAAIAYSKLNLAGSIVNADIANGAAIGWTKLDKTGSSLADLATRSAADLSSGIIPDARIPGFVSNGTTRINQLAFNPTQSASADANTLDDYEEGTWTPTLGGTSTYTTQLGTYTKIGRLVHIHIRLTVNVLGTGSTNTISGLPFTPTANHGLAIGYFANLSNTCYYLTATTSGATIIFNNVTALTNTMGSGASIFQNGTDIMIDGCFITT